MSSNPGFASRLFVSGSAGFLLIGVYGAAVGVVLPEFTRVFGLSDGAVGLFPAVWGLGSVLIVAAGTMGVRGLTARLSALLLALGGVLIATGAGWLPTLLGAFLAGAGFGITASHVNRAFLTGFGPRGPSMVGLVNAINAIGLVAAPLLLVAAGGSPRLLYAALAMFAVACMALYPAREDGFAGALRGLPPLGRREIGLLALITGSTVIESGLAAFSALALIALGRAADHAYLLVSAYFAAFFLGRLSLYWLTRHVAPERLLLAAAIGAACGAALAMGGLAEAGYVLTGAFVGIAFPSAYIWQARLLGPDPRMASSMVLAGLTGGVIGPVLFAAVLGVAGVANLFLLTTIVAAVLSLAIIRSLSQNAPPAPAAPA